MKKFIAAVRTVADLSLSKSVWARSCACVFGVVSAGCGTTQSHWDAVQMRQNVVEYYNDEIMDNLIRASNGQPFVHVDVTGLSALVGSKVTGAVNAGQTLNNTGTRQVTNQTVTTDSTTATGAFTGHMVQATAGVVGTIAHAAMRPFTVSVAPERSDNVAVNSTPVVGENADVIYDLYLQFLNLKKNGKLCESGRDFSYLDRPACLESLKSVCTLKERLALSPKDYVPGTVKERGGCLYYIPTCFRKQYLELCKELLTKKRPKPTSLAPSPGFIVQ
jgi:hypothetical protein